MAERSAKLCEGAEGAAHFTAGTQDDAMIFSFLQSETDGGMLIWERWIVFEFCNCIETSGLRDMLGAAIADLARCCGLDRFYL